MNTTTKWLWRSFTAAALTLTMASAGSAQHARRAPTPSLGSISDDIWRRQEHNAEASDFVVHQHEFELSTTRLNLAGEDHVKEIAQRMCNNQFPVVIERSMMSVRPGTKFGYPVHPNPMLDMRRREIVVRALNAMGVVDADERVVVAPAFAEGYRANEAIRAYYRGINFGGGGGGFGGGGFGGGGFGGGGFF